MTAIAAPARVEPRPAGFFNDLVAVAGRALRQIPREPEFMVPAIIVPLFFFAINIGALEKVAEAQAHIDFKAFELPVSIIFAVTGISRASTLVTDIQGGYFDRLMVTPIRRLALLLGLMVADFAMVVALTIPVLVLGFVVGVGFESGPLGVLVFVLLAALWGLVFTGFPYAIALKTGNPAAVQSAFLLFFPFLFLTSSYVPRSQLTGWLNTVAAWNPVTYLLGGLRSLTMQGWQWTQLGQALAAIAVVAAISMSLCFGALRGRLNQD